MKTIRVALPILMLAFCSLPSDAQGAYLPVGVNGFGGELKVALDPDGLLGMEIFSGYSIAGILDVGASVDVGLGRLGGYDATDLRTAFEMRISLVKQTEGVPLSLQLVGSYGLNNVLSEYLDNDNATKRGTGYALGLNLSSNIRLLPFWLLRASLFGEYGSITYTTQGDTLNTVEREGSLYFGGTFGFLFVFPRGATIAILVELRANPENNIQIGPVLAVAFPQN
jgi:hypothetical protein